MNNLVDADKRQQTRHDQRYIAEPTSLYVFVLNSEPAAADLFKDLFHRLVNAGAAGSRENGYECLLRILNTCNTHSYDFKKVFKPDDPNAWAYLDLEGSSESMLKFRLADTLNEMITTQISCFCEANDPFDDEKCRYSLEIHLGHYTIYPGNRYHCEISKYGEGGGYNSAETDAAVIKDGVLDEDLCRAFFPEYLTAKYEEGKNRPKPEPEYLVSQEITFTSPISLFVAVYNNVTTIEEHGCEVLFEKLLESGAAIYRELQTALWAQNTYNEACYVPYPKELDLREFARSFSFYLDEEGSTSSILKFVTLEPNFAEILAGIYSFMSKYDPDITLCYCFSDRDYDLAGYGAVSFGEIVEHLVSPKDGNDNPADNTAESKDANGESDDPIPVYKHEINTPELLCERLMGDVVFVVDMLDSAYNSPDPDCKEYLYSPV